MTPEERSKNGASKGGQTTAAMLRRMRPIRALQAVCNDPFILEHPDLRDSLRSIQTAVATRAMVVPK